jgi:hypothetical protein
MSLAHGKHTTYINKGCRCPLCRYAANHNSKLRKSGLAPSERKLLQANYESYLEALEVRFWRELRLLDETKEALEAVMYRVMRSLPFEEYRAEELPPDDEMVDPEEIMSAEEYVAQVYQPAGPPTMTEEEMEEQRQRLLRTYGGPFNQPVEDGN